MKYYYIVLFCYGIAQCDSKWFNTYNTSNYSYPQYAMSNSNTLRVIVDWKFLDFAYPSFELRQQAISERQYIPQNNLPLGVDFYKNRIFITTPRWKDGVPASLGYVDYPPAERSPPLKPYPFWNAHADPYNPDCSKLISVYRTFVDECGRLWAIDAGVVNATIKLNQICPPKIVAFDLNTDIRILSYEIPGEFVKQDSLHSNIIVNIENGDCDDTYVYVTDVWRFGVLVYSLKENNSWRITNFNFSPNPIAADFTVHGLNFQWLDGVFGMTIATDQQKQKFLYFHPMASYKEFKIRTDIIQNASLWKTTPPAYIAQAFQEVGDRGPMTQSSTSGISRNGVMFFTQVQLNNIACWDSNKPYLRANVAHLVEQNSIPTLDFPNDIKVDKEQNQGLWVMSNRLPVFLYSQLNFNEVNFQILHAEIENAISNTICDPSLLYQNQNSGYANVIIKEGQCY